MGRTGRLGPCPADLSSEGGRSRGGTAVLVHDVRAAPAEVELSEGRVSSVRGLELETRVVRCGAEEAEAGGWWAAMSGLCG